MEAKLLILDLDETLIHGTKVRLARAEDFRFEQYFIYKRPGLDTFLQFCFEHFNVAVWSSAALDYANAVIRGICLPQEQLQFVWARERCTYKVDPESGTSYWIKDLKKVRRLGHSLETVLVIDDSPEKLKRNYGNHIHITPFEGDVADDELNRLKNYLGQLKEVPNVRVIEKRSWRSSV